jgi:hypothetical protein
MTLADEVADEIAEYLQACRDVLYENHVVPKTGRVYPQSVRYEIKGLDTWIVALRRRDDHEPALLRAGCDQ